MRNLLGIGALTAFTLVACGKPAPQNDDLGRALDQASSPGLALAPQAGRTQVVSNIERAPTAAPAPRRSEPRRVAAAARVAQAPAPQLTPPVQTPPEPAVIAPAPTAVSATQPSPNVQQSPRPAPQQPARRGKYKTEAEVFRDAPFPILP